MSLKDRTQEFLSSIESSLSRSTFGPSETHRLLQQHRDHLLSSSTSTATTPLLSSSSSNLPTSLSSQTALRSEFTRMSASIGKDITTTVLKLQKLTRLAKRKTLFDDRPVEINELIMIIKQDIAKLNKQIAMLQSYTNEKRQQGGLGHKQMQDHTSSVITSLQSKLANTSNDFKRVLEIRTQNMREAKTRKDQYSAFGPGGGNGSGSGSGSAGNSSANGGAVDGLIVAGAPAPSGQLGTTAAFAAASTSFMHSDSPLFNPDRKPFGGNSSSNTGGSSSGNNNFVIDMGTGSLGADVMGGGGVGGQQSQMMVSGGSSYMNGEYMTSRANAIESIESTIAELGQIYSQFATILAGQREQIQRIDDNMVDVEMNVSGAHSQLLKYYENISSNRWLMIKVFMVIIFFFLVFAVVM